MRSLSSRCCLIVPLVCAFMVASQTFTIKSASVEKGHFIDTKGAAPGNDVKIVSNGVDASTVFIDPMPESVGSVVDTSIMDTHSSLYVCPRNPATPGTHLEWSYAEYKWQIERTRHDKYVIYHQAPHSNLSWYDGNTVGHSHVLSKTIELNVNHKMRFEWDIDHKTVVD